MEDINMITDVCPCNQSVEKIDNLPNETQPHDDISQEIVETVDAPIKVQSCMDNTDKVRTALTYTFC